MFSNFTPSASDAAGAAAQSYNPVQVPTGSFARQIQANMPQNLWSSGTPILDFLSPKPAYAAENNGQILGVQYQQPAGPQNSPTSTPAPTQNNNNNQNQGGGGTDIMQYYQGWNPDQARADFQQAFGGDINRLRTARGFGGENNNNPLPAWMSAYDQSYQPLLSQLESWKTSLGPQLQEQQATMESRKQAALGETTAQEEAQQGKINRQAADAEEAAQRQAFQQGQAALSRFGGGPGTIGEGAQTALQQEAMRGWTQIERSKADALAQTHVVALQANDKVIGDTKSAIDQLNFSFNNLMQQVDAEKAATEGEKTQAKLGLINNYIQTNNQIRQDYDNKFLGIINAIGNTYAYVAAVHGQMPDFNQLYSGLMNTFQQVAGGGLTSGPATPNMAAQIAGNLYGVGQNDLNQLLGIK